MGIIMSRREKSEEQRLLEREAASLWGKHVSRRKGIALILAATLACALPMVLGIRLWDKIPEIVESGLIGFDGKDDALPRWVVCFGIPGLMCILNVITHGQLLYNQSRGTMPPKSSRLLGRWGFPFISVIFCSGLIIGKSGAENALPIPFLVPSVLGLAEMFLGSHMIDLPSTARLAMKFSGCDDEALCAIHNFAGYFWLATGLILIAGAMWEANFAIVFATILISLVVPFAYGFTRGHASSKVT